MIAPEASPSVFAFTNLCLPRRGLGRYLYLVATGKVAPMKGGNRALVVSRLEMRSELAKSGGVRSPLTDRVAKEGNCRKSFGSHFHFFDRGQRREDLPLGFSLTSQRNKSFRNDEM